MRHAKHCALVTLLLAPVALAQPAGLPGFELERLELNPNGRGSLLMGTGELLPTGAFRLSLAGQYENDPLVMYREGTRLGSVVGDRVTAHLLAAWAPLQWLELGAQVPLVLWQRGEDLTAQGVETPERMGLSTPVAHARLGLLAQRREAPLDLALELGLGLPVGSTKALSRDSLLRFSPRVMAGRRFGWLRAGVDVGMLARPSVVLGDESGGRDELGNEVRLGAVLATTGEGLRGELNVRAALPVTREPSSLELLAGLRLPLGESFEAYALGGPGFGDAPGTPTFRLLLGVAYAGGGRRDDDGDGVRNEEDACPNEVGTAERKGCPVRDSDGDGIEDRVDKCPKEAGTAELKGCPVRDSDGDTVSDHLDNCPNEKGEVTNQGCPAKEEQMVVIGKGGLEIKEQVFFATGKSIIQPRSFKMLDQVAQVIKQHPEIEKVVIEGHTDDRGRAELNRKLSQMRAEAVMSHLVSKGVEPARLEAKGYGPDRPIASNETEEGRAANRRVAFIIPPTESGLK